ncbi:MAG TPA: TIM barrel protein [Acidimicrobiales bacterium]|nr:TIM barrel protein [Acidimicrobiales bacterium]
MSVHPRVCVSGISSWNQSIPDDLALYQRIGIHTIGASLRKLTSQDDVDRLARSGLHIANVIGVGHAGLDQAVDVARRLGAPAVVFTTGPAGALEWADAADRLASALTAVAHESVRLCLEHTNSLRVDVSFVHTLRDAIDLARRLEIDVCMEINACWAERDLARTIADGIDRIGIVQVSDFAVGTLSTPNRLVPGDGDIPLRRIIGQLLEAGYTGVFDLELVGPAIEAEGYASALDRSCTYLSEMLTELGAG